jgi:uncharacterized cupredoxin-like copper-binding protein
MKKLLVLAGFIVFTACGGGANEETTTNESAPEVEETTEVADDNAGDDEVIVINLTTTGETMTDMAFEPKQVKVPAGSTVRVVLDNVAEAHAMIHNFVLIDRGSSEEIYPLAIEAGPNKNYVPDHSGIYAATPMANPGEKVEIEFTAPSAGIYQYICTYPGHASMKGIFVSE